MRSDSTPERPFGGGLPVRLPSTGLRRRQRSWSVLPPLLPLPKWVGTGMILLGLAACIAKARLELEPGILDVVLVPVGLAIAVIPLFAAGITLWWSHANQRRGWRTIVVGDEGFWLKRATAADRFVSFDNVADIEKRKPERLSYVQRKPWGRLLSRWPSRESDEVELAMWHRCRVKLVRGFSTTLSSPEPGLASALDAALGFYRSLEPPPDVHALALSGDFERRTTELRGLLSKTKSYRSASLSVEQLSETAEHPKASGALRVAAALALSGAGRDEQERAKRAAQNVAHPALARAMVAALKGRLDRATFEEASKAVVPIASH